MDANYADSDPRTAYSSDEKCLRIGEAGGKNRNRSFDCPHDEVSDGAPAHS